MRARLILPLHRPVVVLLLAVFCLACPAQGGEKIRFSGRDGAKSDAEPGTKPPRYFDIPDLLGSTRNRKDPLAEIVPVVTPARTSFDTKRDRKSDGKEGELTGDEKRGLAEVGDDERNQGLNGNNSFMNTTPNGQDRSRFDGSNSSNTNRFRLGERGSQSEERLTWRGSNPDQGGLRGVANAAGGGLSSSADVAARPGLLGLNWQNPGQDGRAFGGAQMNANGLRGTPGGGFEATSFMNRNDSQGPQNRNRSPLTGDSGRSGLGNGSFSGSPGFGAGDLNDFKKIAGPGAIGAPAPVATAPEAPKFQPKPAVLEIPKRKF